MMTVGKVMEDTTIDGPLSIHPLVWQVELPHAAYKYILQ